VTGIGGVLRDPERLAALRGTGLLDTATSEPFDQLTRLAARILHAPIALLTLVDADRQYFKAAVGLPEALAGVRETSLEYSICQYAVGLGCPLVVCDARIEHWLDGNPAVAMLGVQSYAGIPLVMPDGYALGTLCVADMVPRNWTDDELASLDDLAAMAMWAIRPH
jgi:GAF domain-containing protein